ncbi:LOB domain-containing protein 19 [Ricinus communis]|uniref:LOB domain-containing protein, putative n=1 Tax=Ricinus communis TaxID=3988 RepID=B9RDE0_RICCO|nr:LOB domain-containing protein 19 [Ricinus communis]EEF50398.1 LOB domain-containing protein, putative [Ricinus communis]|eukprot:XP_002511729.1 LOB domain-containing protein 19 [Ricinus communis]
MNGGGGPCGACKFLRRKCLKGCIFAPYFDSDQGTAHFAAVHKVFGASNASKLLLRIPAHKRFDAVVTLCYEALARVRDPVYGCVGHLFTLQQQVVSLQAELAYIQARLSTLQRHQHPSQPAQSHSQTSVLSSSTSEMPSNSNMSMHFDQLQLQPQHVAVSESELTNVCHPLGPQLENDELQALARDFVSRYLPGVRFKPTSSQ